MINILGVIIIKKFVLFSIITIFFIGSSCSSMFGSDDIPNVNANSINYDNNSKENAKDVIDKGDELNISNENDSEEYAELEFVLPKNKQDYFKEVDITFKNSYQDDFTYPIDSISLEEPLTISVMLPTHVNPTNLILLEDT